MKYLLLAILYAYAILYGFAQQTGTPVPAIDFLKAFPNARDFTLSSDGKEAYLTLQNLQEDIAVIVRTTAKGKKWSQPQLVSFTGKFRDIEPFLSHDGLRLYFASDRPLSDTGTIAKDYDIWYVQRGDHKSEWSSPVNLGAPVNTASNEFYPCLVKNGNLYFTTDWDSSTGKDDIFFSEWKNGFSTPVPLSTAVNSDGHEFNAFVAPDESYLLFTGYNRKDGLGSGDLYISKKNMDGTWGEAQNMGVKYNSKWMDYCPFVDPNTKTLYFTSRRSNVKHTGFSSIREFSDEVNSYENGLSRIYKIYIGSVLQLR